MANALEQLLAQMGVPVMPEVEDYAPPRLMTGGALGEAGQPAGWSMHDYALQHLQDVVSGKVAYQGVLGSGYKGSEQDRLMDIAGGLVGGPLATIGRKAGPGAIRAYHGSPHSFDRFDISKIGTGEGAQAYGHGLYFAEAEDVARGYRDTLAGKAPLKEYGGQPLETRKDWFSLIDRVEPQDWRLAQIIDAAGKQGGIRSALDTFEPHTRNASDGPQWAAAIEKFKEGVGPAAKGHMYEVSLHADPKALLDWDRPLAGQPEPVRQALGIGDIVGAPKHEAVSAAINEARAAGVPLKDYPPYRALQEQNRQATAASYDALGVRNVPGILPGDLQASAYHTGLIDRLGDPIAASERLREAGIPGIRYLDQGSRFNPAVLPDNPIANEARDFLKAANGDSAAALQAFKASNPIERWGSTERDEVRKVIEAAARQPTSNYAIFDPTIIEIRRKYGLPLGIGAGGLGGLGGLGGQETYY